MLKRLLLLFCIVILAQSCKGRCKKRCQEGWTTKSRTLGDWCVKVVPMTSAAVYKSDAAAKCAEFGAVLSSFESFLEFVSVSQLLTAQNLQTGFLGAENSPNCTCPYSDTVFSCEQTTDCNLLTAWQWTDNFTVGRAAFNYIFSPFDTNWRQFLIVTGGPGIQVGYVNYGSAIVGWTDGEVWNGNYTAGAVCGRLPE